MRVLELITDIDGSMSHTKLWANIAYSVATVVVVTHPTYEMLSVYLGAVILGRASSKAIDSMGRKPDVAV